MTWLPISSAPKDGRLVNLKREVEGGRIVEEGTGLWGTLAEHAPLRLDDPKWGAEPKWVRPDRQFAFPVPTHWKPLISPNPSGGMTHADA